VQRHTHSLEIEATPEEAWSILHPRPPKPNAEGRRVMVHGDVTIEILDPGDEHGKGLVRATRFRVPKWLLTKGVGQSWEIITEASPHQTVRYLAMGKPLWSRAEGTHTFTDIGGGRTRVTFEETYQAFNPLTSRLLEARVHAFISKDNQRLIKQAFDQGLPYLRAKRAQG
jgi:hypothetical protein